MVSSNKGYEDGQMSHLPRIITICGLKRSGKDTLADAFVSKLGYEKIKIAEGLKDMLGVLFGFTEDQLEGCKKDSFDPQWGVTPRQLMQFMGTEIMQYELQKVLPSIGRSFWIQRLVRQHIEKNPHKKYVISDMRFLHEYDTLAPYKPYVIRVHRNAASSNETFHVSETEYTRIPANILFENNGNIANVHAFVARFKCSNTFSQI